MKFFIVGGVIVLFLGFAALKDYSDTSKERDYYVDMLGMAGRKLCERKRAASPEFFAGDNCDCNGWEWTNIPGKARTVDVGVVCIREVKP